jgi:hypothetical protein
MALIAEKIKRAHGRSRAMASFLTDLYALAAALALIALVAWLIRRLFRAALAPRQFRRSASYVSAGKPQFDLLGIVSEEAVSSFLTFLQRRYGARLLEQALDPDDQRYRIGRRRDFVDVLYAEHLGARVRAGDASGGGLFAKLLDDVPT